MSQEESSATAPKFGEWGGDNVPYTLYFENARKKKDQSKRINANEPREDPEAFSKASSLRTAPQPEEPTRPRPERRITRDEEYLHQAAYIPARHVSDGHRSRGETPHRMSGDQAGSIDPGRRPSQLVAERGHSSGNTPPHWNAEVIMAEVLGGEGSFSSIHTRIYLHLGPT